MTIFDEAKRGRITWWRKFPLGVGGGRVVHVSLYRGIVVESTIYQLRIAGEVWKSSRMYEEGVDMLEWVN